MSGGLIPGMTAGMPQGGDGNAAGRAKGRARLLPSRLLMASQPATSGRPSLHALTPSPSLPVTPSPLLPVLLRRLVRLPVLPHRFAKP